VIVKCKLPPTDSSSLNRAQRAKKRKKKATHEGQIAADMKTDLETFEEVPGLYNKDVDDSPCYFDRYKQRQRLSVYGKKKWDLLSAHGGFLLASKLGQDASDPWQCAFASPVSMHQLEQW